MSLAAGAPVLGERAAKAGRKALWKDIDHDLAAKDRAKLADLRARLKAARAAHKDAIARARAACRAHRKSVSEPVKAERAAAMAAIKAEGAAERAAARAACVVGEGAPERSAKSGVDDAAGELAAERTYQAEIERAAKGNRAQRRAARGASAKERREESDDAVRGNLPPELVALFDRVKAQIKGSARESRTEAMLRYAEEHPDEYLDAIDDKTDAVIRDLERQMNRARNPSRKAKGKASAFRSQDEIDAAYRAGRLTSKEASAEWLALQRQRIAERDAARVPKYRAGDVVLAKWGERATVTGVVPPRDGAELMYRVTRGHDRGEEIHDMWPAEVVVKKESARAARKKNPSPSPASALERLARAILKDARTLAEARELARVAVESAPDLSDRAVGKALAAYRATHWGEAGKARVVEMRCADPSADILVQLGTLEAVTYRTTKAGHEPGTFYTHDFASPKPVLAYSSEGDGLLVICGGGYRVEARGIVK